MIDRQLVVLQQHPFCCVRPRKTVDPLPMRPRPVPPVVVQATTQEKLPQTMPAPLQILAGIVARATQVTDGFFFGCRRAYLSQYVRAQQLRQFSGIAAIGFDPLAGLSRYERWRDHLATHAGRRDLALRHVAARPGFVARPHGSWSVALEPTHESSHRVRLI